MLWEGTHAHLSMIKLESAWSSCECECNDWWPESEPVSFVLFACDEQSTFCKDDWMFGDPSGCVSSITLFDCPQLLRLASWERTLSAGDCEWCPLEPPAKAPRWLSSVCVEMDSAPTSGEEQCGCPLCLVCTDGSVWECSRSERSDSVCIAVLNSAVVTASVDEECSTGSYDKEPSNSCESGIMTGVSSSQIKGFLGVFLGMWDMVGVLAVGWDESKGCDDCEDSRRIFA